MVKSLDFTDRVEKLECGIGYGKNDHQLGSPKINSIKSCPQM